MNITINNECDDIINENKLFYDSYITQHYEYIKNIKMQKYRSFEVFNLFLLFDNDNNNQNNSSKFQLISIKFCQI